MDSKRTGWFFMVLGPLSLLFWVALGPVAPSTSLHEGVDAVLEAAWEPPMVVEASKEVSAPLLAVPVPAPIVVAVEPELTPASVPETPGAPSTPEVSKAAICVAAAYALNPEWDPTICDRMQDDTNPADPRKERCQRQRASLQKFAETLCATIVEETTRENLDLLLPLAVIERESSGGRVEYDRSMKIFKVETDICEWFLSARRIVSREPGTRAGSEVLVWTYGDDQRTNRQAVRVTEDEMPRGLRINTCLAGEAGIMQTIPREWKRGTVVEATGEVLRGTSEERRARIEADPILQVRLGCQALVEHRDLWPESDRNPWWSWISSYNVGTTTRGEHACGYQRKLLRHYLDACDRGSIPVDGGLPLLLKDVWPGCTAAQRAYDTWVYCEQFRPRDDE